MLTTLSTCWIVLSFETETYLCSVHTELAVIQGSEKKPVLKKAQPRCVLSFIDFFGRAVPDALK